MGRIGKALHTFFSRLSAIRPEGDECRRTVFAPEEEDLLAVRLRKTVEGGRLFLRPGLSLADVAAEMGTGLDTIGRICIRYIGGDFNRYINELRVAYAALLFMGQESHLYSIEKMGIECGFPDNAAFADACRMLTGMTPEVMSEFSRGRKTLKGLFLSTPLYMTIATCETPEERLQTEPLENERRHRYP